MFHSGTYSRKTGSRYPYRKMGFHRLWIPVRYIRKTAVHFLCRRWDMYFFQVDAAIADIRKFFRTVRNLDRCQSHTAVIHGIHVLQLHTGCCIGSLDQCRITVKCFFACFIFPGSSMAFSVRYTLLRRM